jgi:hypothetical protein
VIGVSHYISHFVTLALGISDFKEADSIKKSGECDIGIAI